VFGEITWFDVQGEILRCDWPKTIKNLAWKLLLFSYQKNAVLDQSWRRISPCISNHGISPNDSEKTFVITDNNNNSVVKTTVADPSH